MRIVLMLIFSLGMQAQESKEVIYIDVPLIYERVLERGFESLEIYEYLIEHYARKEDTIRVNELKIKQYELVFKN